MHLLTPCSRVLLENLTSSQLVKKLLTFYGTPKVHYCIYDSFASLSDIKNILLLNTASLLLKTLCLLAYELFTIIGILVLWMCEKSVMQYLLHIIANCKLSPFVVLEDKNQNKPGLTWAG
jgi:hypothetical protein